jgi:hypothetical protein
MKHAFIRRSELVRAAARLSSESFLIGKIPFKRSRQAEHVYFAKYFLVLFGAPKSTEEKDTGKQHPILNSTSKKELTKKSDK